MVKYLAESVVTLLKSQNVKLATAESCTGGMLSSTLTDVQGSSAIFDRGFVTYSNASKVESLGVKPETIQRFGAVSPQTATEMAQGVLAFSHGDLSISITGIAGPDTSENKPVGLVYIAIADKNKCTVVENNFRGNRNTIRHATVTKALQIIQLNFS